MNARPQLDRLDALAAEQGHFSYIAPSRLDAGGIDPLGMGAINLDLVASALPGINNVTSRIRVYSFIAWAWWRARECVAARPAAADARDLQALVDRWEVLFVWSNMLAGTNGGMPGRLKLGGNLPKAGTYRFHGTGWDKLRAVRHTGQTALQSAVAYGPSVKELLWVAPAGSGAFMPTKQAMPAVEEFDARVNAVLPERLLEPGNVSVSVDEVAAMHAAWSADEPSDVEKAVFRKTFHDVGIEHVESGRHRLRARTVHLIRSALEQAPGPVSEHDLRRALASWRFQDGDDFLPAADVRDRALLWPVIQARQLQRQALEGIFCWVENVIDDNGGLASAAALVDAADQAAREGEDGADAGSVATYLKKAASRGDGIGWPAACAWDEPTDIFDLTEALGEAVSKGDWASVPPLALRSIAYAEAIASGVRDLGRGDKAPDLLGGNPDRLPLGAASRRLEMLGNGSMRDLWDEVILSWVVAQHVRWAVARNGDGIQRLRITLDEGGWVRLRPDTRGLEPMQDRLRTVLSLSAECGLVTQARDSQGDPLYSPA